jgi:hypothetical protein
MAADPRRTRRSKPRRALQRNGARGPGCYSERIRDPRGRLLVARGMLNPSAPFVLIRLGHRPAAHRSTCRQPKVTAGSGRALFAPGGVPSPLEAPPAPRRHFGRDRRSAFRPAKNDRRPRRSFVRCRKVLHALAIAAQQRWVEARASARAAPGSRWRQSRTTGPNHSRRSDRCRRREGDVWARVSFPRVCSSGSGSTSRGRGVARFRLAVAPGDELAARYPGAADNWTRLAPSTSCADADVVTRRRRRDPTPTS